MAHDKDLSAALAYIEQVERWLQAAFDYDVRLNRLEKAPTGGDYNAVLSGIEAVIVTAEAARDCIRKVKAADDATRYTDRADHDLRADYFRRIAREQGWDVVPEVGSEDRPLGAAIVHLATFEGAANYNDTEWLTWEGLCEEEGLSDFAQHGEQCPTDIVDVRTETDDEKV